METIIRFAKVFFEFGYNKTILDDVSFSIKNNTKIALMGQNGAGKSTLFKLLTKVLKPDSGEIFIAKNATIATAYQVIQEQDKHLTVYEFFAVYSKLTGHELKRAISKALSAVNLEVPEDKKIIDFSGGQQARLLLAAAIIQESDILLLDEPTNNLDHAGIYHLTQFLITYKKTVIVISHDAEFLNAFTDGVLYLDVHTKKVEYYAGNYNDVVADIEVRIEKQNRQNAMMEREIQERKDNANFFAQKGGKMRNVAKKMYEKVEKLESEKVDVRREDKTIRNFTIPVQEYLQSDVVKIDGYSIVQHGTVVHKKANIFLGKGQHLYITGKNGIGKSTFIEALAKQILPYATITPGVRVGYYKQDFSMLNSEQTVHESLLTILKEADQPVHEEGYRSVAAGFLITPDIIKTQIKHLSEGQKGLVAFARLVLQKPGLLILDEPTNHINFRHLPVIAKALNNYDGAMILVSHMQEFVDSIRIDQTLNLER